jgi:signal transduction histidine kinase
VREKVKEAVAARDGAVADERARIARELHDVVSHHVTAMTLQAEAAAMTGNREALASVATAGRDALTELRRMLGVLRRPETEAGDLDPQPALMQLDALATRSSSGPRVTVERRGDVRPLSAGLELGVYRLVQEALTNTAKHSDATTVEVLLTYGESDLIVEVVDNGRPLVAARVGSGGLGLVGMQERIALLNGELVTGPRTGAQGYRVYARLPIES